ncbi:MAG: hypothetical protein KAS62_09895, partial [Candidatus Delongbacteria bacterium]|nr:hypothetical protein [Candidatus Delongbacteria bacterium]
MKCLLICLIFSMNLFSQFSSNVDYKELSRNKNSFGVEINSSIAEVEWEAKLYDTLVDSIKFTGNYDLFKNDLNINGFYYFDENRLTYSAGFSKATFSSDATIDTTGIRENFDLGEKVFSDINAKLGYVIDDNKYGGSIGLKYFSLDTELYNENCLVTSFDGYFNSESISGNKYGMDITYSLFSDDSLVYRVGYDVLSPEIMVGFYYTFILENFDIRAYSDINVFDQGIYEDNSYVGFGICFHKSFDNINSDLAVDVGSNFTSAFKTPDIPLPYLY